MLIIHQFFLFIYLPSPLHFPSMCFNYTALSHFVPMPLSLSSHLNTFETERAMALWKANTAPLPRCQSIYIKSTVHEISSLKDWTVDGDALGYCLPALSKKRDQIKRYSVTIADLALTLVTCVSINQSIPLYYHPQRDIEGEYMIKPSNLNLS